MSDELLRLMTGENVTVQATVVDDSANELYSARVNGRLSFNTSTGFYQVSQCTFKPESVLKVSPQVFDSDVIIVFFEAR